jgi:hypothetical protein
MRCARELQVASAGGFTRADGIEPVSLANACTDPGKMLDRRRVGSPCHRALQRHRLADATVQYNVSAHTWVIGRCGSSGSRVVFGGIANASSCGRGRFACWFRCPIAGRFAPDRTGRRWFRTGIRSMISPEVSLWPGQAWAPCVPVVLLNDSARILELFRNPGHHRAAPGLPWPAGS